MHILYLQHKNGKFLAHLCEHMRNLALLLPCSLALTLTCIMGTRLLGSWTHNNTLSGLVSLFGIAGIGLITPDESRAIVGERIDTLQIVDEFGHVGVIEWKAHTRDIDLG